jgi:hypothetical protein
MADGLVLVFALGVAFIRLEKQLAGIGQLALKVLGSVDGRYADDDD